VRTIVAAMLIALSIQTAFAQPPALRPAQGRPEQSRGAAGAPMPDPRQMSGVPLPTSELPVGTITVRLIRGALSNPLPGVRVELVGEAQPAPQTTNESGRAQFTGLKPGARVKAVAIVDSERLESQEVQVPAQGGVRFMLVATDPEAARRAEEDQRLAQGPAQRGTVVLGDQSRFVFELGDEGVNVFNILQILNTARVPVEPVTPVVFVLPDGAAQAALLEGSSPLATAEGTRVNVRGPFPPGITLVQFAYTLPYGGGSMRIRQVLPAQLAQFSVVAQKAPEMRLSSAQVARQREMATDGQTYILGQGPALAAGAAFEVELTGLPHAATWPRNVALSLALLILCAGAVVAVRGSRSSSAAADRSLIETRREALLTELTMLEAGHRGGTVDAGHYAARRHELVSALERVYASLDQQWTSAR
jgi:hypothetical protein